jgi:hypothetical protein
MSKKSRVPLEACTFSAGTIIEDTICFFSDKEDILMGIHMSDWKIRYLDLFTGQNRYFSERADFLRTCDDKIFKLALNGKSIEEYSFKDKKYEKIWIEEFGCDKEWDNFIAFERKGEYLYIIPKWKREAFKLEIHTHKTEKIDLTLNNENFEKEFECFCAAYRLDDKIWLFEEKNRRAVVFDMSDDTFSFYALPDEIKNFVDVCQKGDDFCFLTSHQQLYTWSPDTDKHGLLWEDRPCSGTENYFGKVVAAGSRIILLPALGEKIVILDDKNREEAYCSEYPEDFFYLDVKWGKYVNGFEDKSFYYFPMRMSNYLLKISKTDGEIEWQRPKLPFMEEKLSFLQQCTEKCPVVMTEGFNNIELLFDYLDQCLETKKKKEEKRIHDGAQIWNQVDRQ